jgi:predicted  nucleic acid-binding Zn-ribbon protein
MRTIEDYEEDELRATDRCHSAWAEKVDTLENANMALETRIADLEAEVERISKERDDAREDAKEWHKLYEASLAKQSFNAALTGSC